MRKLVFLLPLCVVCFSATAEDATCTAKDFRGVYAFQAHGTNVTNNTPITFAGSLTADGNGNITAWKDWVAVPADPPVPPNFKFVPPVRDIHEMARTLGNDIRYTVEPDCRITIRTTVPGPGGVLTAIVQVGALAFGGDEALLINGSPTNPYVSVITLKRSGKERQYER